MTFPLDLIRRVLLLVGLVLLSLPLWSLSGAASDVSRLSVAEIVEIVVLVFIVVAGALGILDSSLFVASRLFRPALVFGAAVLAVGICDLLFQFPSARAAAERLLASTTSYFVIPSSADLLQPTLWGLELAALAPLVEITMRRRRPMVRASGWALLVVGIALACYSASPFVNIDIRDVVSVRLAQAAGELLELRLAGLAGLGWLLWAGLRAPAFSTQTPDRTARLALLAATLLLLLEVVLDRRPVAYLPAVGAFVAIGLTAAMAPRPSSPGGTGEGRWILRVLCASILVAASVRAWAALMPPPPQVTGLGALQPALDDEPYRVAEQRFTWTLPARTRVVWAPMRWDKAAAWDCYVRIKVAGRPDDVVSLMPDRWIVVRLAVPQGDDKRGQEKPTVVFEVTSPACRPLVGTITTAR
ncbi:MAG TPA: hypothetical protein VN700_07500 [Vicinamibacterales bacterium]|nr:hypothetical protein [Vicinamibacterales bacterium]